MTPTRWARAALVAWVVLLSAVCLRPFFRPVSGTVYVTYATAGEEFAAGRRLYDVMHPFTDNYRYSPVVAAGFTPFSLLPLGLGGALWRALGAAAFLTGLAAWADRACPGVPRPALFLLALPLSITSLNNGQANTHVLGLMLWGTVLAARGRWALAAVLVAGAALVKGYPLAFGLLVALAAPVRFGLPLLLAVAAGLALPYTLQSPEYVTDQYRFWLENLARDDRTSFPLHAGLQDFQMLLRVAGVNVPLGEYRLVEVAAGAVAAAVIGWQLRRGTDLPQVVLNAFTLGVCWMTVFGPGVESATFILLAPVAARELLDPVGRPRWTRPIGLAGAGLFAVSVAVKAFPHAIHQPVIALGVMPLGALLVACAAAGRVLAPGPVRSASPVPAVDLPLSRAA